MTLHEAAEAMLLAIEREMPDATETAYRFPEIEAARLALATADPLRVLVTVSGGMASVDFCPRGVTVEVRDMDSDDTCLTCDGDGTLMPIGPGSDTAPPITCDKCRGSGDAGPRTLEYGSDPDTGEDVERTVELVKDGDNWRRADNARPEFDGPEPQEVAR